MARIILPVTFSQQLVLRNGINAKYIADGPGGELQPYIAEQKIMMADTTTAGLQAKTYEDNRLLFEGNAKSYGELRDNTFALPWAHFRSMAQFLKGLYRGNVGALTAWGIDVVGDNKIVYPAAFTAKAEMMQKFYLKSNAYPKADNPLKPFLTKQGIDIATDAAAVATASGYNTSMDAAAGDAENMRELRDTTWLPVVKIIEGIAGYLKKLYDKNPQGLIAYGFEVDESPQAPKIRKTSLKLGEQITINAATIGGHFKNTGTTALHLYRGKTTTGTPVIVLPGGEYGILKGWSTITVVNPDLLNGGKFEVLTNA